MRRVLALASLVVAALAACATQADDPGSYPGDRVRGGEAVRPDRFTIVPDDFHVPYAGTAEDGRLFFLSDELFQPGRSGGGFVGLYLWNADGSFSEVRVDPVGRSEGRPPAQAGAGPGAEELVEQRLAELGDYELGPIEVEPFLETVDGVGFGWAVTKFRGTYSINLAPGDFIAYYEPWDGLGYDT